MIYKKYIFIFLFLFACSTNNTSNKDTKIVEHIDTFSTKGFALIYNEDLYKKKIINKKLEKRSLLIFQKNLKKETSVKITNPLNNKSILVKVGANSKYPNFYNSVISQRVFDELDLNYNEPYIEIATVSANSAFVAKKAKMYEEEKEVADKAPVDGISISDLSKNKKKIKKNKKIDNFNYITKIIFFFIFFYFFLIFT